MNNNEQQLQLQRQQQKSLSFLEEQFLMSEELKEIKDAIFDYLTKKTMRPILLAGLNLRTYLGRMGRSVVIAGQRTRAKKRRSETESGDGNETPEGLDSARRAHRTKDTEGHKKRSGGSVAEGRLEMRDGKVKPGFQAGKASSADIEDLEETVTLIRYSSPEDVDELIRQSGGRASIVKRAKTHFPPRKIKSILKTRKRCISNDSDDDERAITYSQSTGDENRRSRDAMADDSEDEEVLGERVVYTQMSVPRNPDKFINKAVQLNVVEAAPMEDPQLHNLVFTEISTSKPFDDSSNASQDIYTSEELQTTIQESTLGSEQVSETNRDSQSDESKSNLPGSIINKRSEPQKKFWMCMQHNEKKEFTLTLPKVVIASNDREKQKHWVISADMIKPGIKRTAGVSKEMSSQIEEKRSRFISSEDAKLLNRLQRYPASDNSDSSDYDSEKETYLSSDDDFVSTDDEGLVIQVDDDLVTDEEEFIPFGAQDPATYDDKQTSRVVVPHILDENDSDILPREYVEMVGSELLTLEHESEVAVGGLRAQLSIITNHLRQGKKTIKDQLKTDTRIKKKALKHRCRRATALYDFFKMDENRAFSRELGRMAEKLKQSCVHHQPAFVNLITPEIDMENVGSLNYTSWLTPIEEHQFQLKDKLGRVEGNVKGFYAISETGRFLSIDKKLVNYTKKFESLSVAWNGKLALLSTGKTDIAKISILTDHFAEYENLKVLSEVKICTPFFSVFEHTIAFVTNDQVRFYLKNSKNVWNYELKTFKPENCMVIDDNMYLVQNDRILEINSETRDTMIYESVLRTDTFSVEKLIHFVRNGFRILTTTENLHVFNPDKKDCSYYLMNSTFEDKILLSYYITQASIIFCLRSKDDFKDLSIQKFPLEESYF
ncbi:DgyrCDS3671 [Dimorphilus gyrociliatus]|uniref:DgyrCDS3671 n=1 Tax=Dimorphilus gyrociliatus TaxID=2664684 RepID=A0A7I8VDU9_9ANNE|nr:DgyrCDS3671 [Dimorphilus gyrociliatus]